MQNHEFGRYVLPVSEADIKNQDWPGKKKDDKGQSKTKDNAEDQPGGEKANGHAESQDNKTDGPELTDDQRVFLDKLIAEMHLVESFKNNPGRPKGELKLLNGDALQQLESHLSIDDQCVTSSWVP